MRRESGILLSVTSLPSRYGIGCFSKEAYEFVDRLEACGQSYWQILPLGPTSYGDSPYQSFSTFAGNPYMISLERLVEEGVLTREECDGEDFGNKPGSVDYEKMYQARYRLLRKAYERSRIAEDPEFQRFREENGWWLRDYAIFMAVKNVFGGQEWTKWAEDIRLRWANAMEYYQREYYFDIEFHEYMQYQFIRQWRELKAYANGKGIRLIGDIPIYVSPDSSDLWTRPELFQTDGQVRLTRVAGCPPDSFAADGQLWGNPLYDWPRHEAEGFAWWKQRMRHATSIYDVVRIDHFRGFESYFSIPAGSATAQGGQWVKGPGQAFLDAMHQAVGRDAVIAEDLGYLTDEVKALLAASGCPGMKIMQFAFDSREPGNYLPYTYTAHSVVYTGTHDNITTEGWQQSASREDVAYACRYLRCEPAGLTDAMICACLASVSDLTVIPMADWLHLGPEARINTPSTQSGNWRWRLDAAALTPALAARIADWTGLYGRRPA